MRVLLLRMMMPLKAPPILTSLKAVKGARKRKSLEARIRIGSLGPRETRWVYVQVVPTVPNSPLVSVALEAVVNSSMIFEGI